MELQGLFRLLTSGRLVAFSGYRISSSGAPLTFNMWWTVTHLSHCPSMAQETGPVRAAVRPFYGAAEGDRMPDITSLPTIRGFEHQAKHQAEESSVGAAKGQRSVQAPLGPGSGGRLIRLHPSRLRSVAARDTPDLNPSCRSARPDIFQAFL